MQPKRAKRKSGLTGTQGKQCFALALWTFLLATWQWFLVSGDDKASSCSPQDLRLVINESSSFPGSLSKSDDAQNLYFWRSGQLFLPGKQHRLRSRNGLYYLELSETGELAIFKVSSTNTNNKLWWTNTQVGWPVQFWAEITSGDGVLRIRRGVRSSRNDELRPSIHPSMRPPDRSVDEEIWTSLLLFECKERREFTFLMLDNLGQLRKFGVPNTADGGLLTDDDLENVVSNSTPHCIINKDRYQDQFGDDSAMQPHDQQGAHRPSPKGNLAIVLAGELRTFRETCANAMKYVITTWPEQYDADVFVFSYIAIGMVHEQSIAAVKACYGNHLKKVELHKKELVEEKFPNIQDGKNCGMKLHRLLSQTKTIFKAGELMFQYMLEEGKVYEYVLRMRPDHDFLGPLPQWAPVPPNVIVLPAPFREHLFFCGNHDQIFRIGPTDQTAFGRLNAMSIYLNMYHNFVSTIRGSKLLAKQDHSVCHHAWPEPCHAKDPCSIECFTGYYLFLHGLQIENRWEWNISLLRGRGRHDKDCPRGWNC